MLLVALSLLVSGCATPLGSTSGPGAAPTAWNTPTPVSGTQPNSNGAMLRANGQGTGVYASDAVRQLTGPRWQFKTGKRGSVTTPAFWGSGVYFAQDGRLYAVDAGTGMAKWNRKLDDIRTSAPAIAGDLLYIGAWEALYAVRPETGLVQWIFQAESRSDDSFYGDPVVEGGTVYFAAWKSLLAVDSASGRQKWKHELSGLAVAVPTVYQGSIYIATYTPDDRETPYIYALDSATGQEKWKLRAPGIGITGAVALADGVAYVGTDEGLLALDAATGQQQWRYPMRPATITSPAIAYGMVYNLSQGTLHALDAKTGQEQWRLPTGDDYHSDPVIAGGVLYFSSTNYGLGILFGAQPKGALYAVDLQSHQELWEFSVIGAVHSGPALSNGTIYLGTGEGILDAIR
ncbi:MAG TPA: PQQ-binding-like beta-propeller repeat protein [Chloroflexia bacterium]|nr:PQQ-binding-like beta-propeller repeat protein [Chloroflexia bacterium]